MRDRKLLRVLAVLFTFALLAAACGDDDADEAGDDPGQAADTGSGDSGEAVDSDDDADTGDAADSDEPAEVSDTGDTADSADSDGEADGADAAPAPSGTFVFAVNQEPQDLAAQGTYKEINAPGLRNVVETLIAVDPDGTTVPVLAESWDVIDDSTIRFTIRDGVSFHVRGNPSGDFGLTLQANYACPSLDDPTGPSRSSVYCNEQFDADLAAASGMTGQARADALAALVEFVHNEHLIVPLALVDRAYLVDDSYTFRFGVDHRILVAYISPAS